MWRKISKIIITLLLTGCISEYIPEGVENVEGILVVEGIISEGETVIKLSTSIGIEDDFYDDRNIYDATVNIECNDGTFFQPLEINSDGYKFSIENLNSSKEYRLNIDYDGNQYQSEFLAPISTPDIDSVYYKKAGTGEPVALYIATHNDNEQSSYYMWSFVEDWEYNAEFEATLGEIYIDGSYEIVYYDLNTSNNIYYCWGHNTSKTFILGSTSNISSNIVKDQYLTESLPGNRRWQTLYRIAVTQNAIRKDAYDYFSNLRKNIEETGSIFGPIPSEMNGNINCVNNSDIPVIGYVDVSISKSFIRYISRNEGLYERPYYGCRIVFDSQEADSLEYILYHIDQMGIQYYAQRFCSDCTLGGGTKNRPDNWPTNNL